MSKSILETLVQNNINFSVCVALNTFILRGVKDNSRDYFINILRCDLEKIPTNSLRSRFKPSEDYTALLQLELTPHEVVIFKNSQSIFKKILHTKHGRVFELKTISFKEAFNEFKLLLDAFFTARGKTFQELANSIPDGETKREELDLLIKSYLKVDVEDLYILEESDSYLDVEKDLIKLLK